MARYSLFVLKVPLNINQSTLCQKIVNAALKAKVWTFEAKAITFGLKDYITG